MARIIVICAAICVPHEINVAAVSFGLFSLFILGFKATVLIAIGILFRLALGLDDVIMITGFIGGGAFLFYIIILFPDCKKYLRNRKYYRNKKWRDIIYNIITGENEIPVIETEFDFQNSRNDLQVNYYYDNGNNSISKRSSKESGEFWYDVRGSEFTGFEIELFMEFNNIEPDEFFYTDSLDNAYYRLNGKYFEIASGYGNMGINIGLFEITREQYAKERSMKNYEIDFFNEGLPPFY